MGRRRNAGLRFEQRLVLNQWMLGLSGVEGFEGLADEEIKDPRYEEWDANNVSGIHHLLAGRFHDLPGRTGGPSVEDLLRYDGNIVRHTARIGAKRENRIRWKCFQYLSLLFAEVFLDRFHETIKDIEKRLGDPKVFLNSFIISNTLYGEVAFWGYSKEEFEGRHVLFQEEDKHTYVKTMLERILGRG